MKIYFLCGFSEQVEFEIKNMWVFTLITKELNRYKTMKGVKVLYAEIYRNCRLNKIKY